MPRPEFTGFRQYYDVAVDTPGPVGGDPGEKKEVERPSPLKLSIILERLRNNPDIVVIGRRTTHITRAEGKFVQVDISIAPSSPTIEVAELNGVLKMLKASLEELGVKPDIQNTSINDDGSMEIGQLRLTYPLITEKAEIKVDLHDPDTLKAAGLEYLVDIESKDKVEFTLDCDVTIRLLPEKTFAGVEFEREEKSSQLAGNTLPQESIKLLDAWIARNK